MRDSTIDIAKGIGIFLVVLGHFTVFASPLYHYIYLFHMPLFFFISGMFAKPTSIKNCLTQRKTPTCPLFILLDFLSDNSICWPNYTFSELYPQ